MWERGRNESATFIKNLIISLFLMAHNQGNEKSGGSKRDGGRFYVREILLLIDVKCAPAAPGRSDTTTSEKDRRGPAGAAGHGGGPGAPRHRCCPGSSAARGSGPRYQSRPGGA